MNERLFFIGGGHLNSFAQRTTASVLIPAALIAGLLLTGCSKEKPLGNGPPARLKVSKEFRHFVEEKEQQAAEAAQASGQKLMPEFKTLFSAAAKGNWGLAKGTFDELARHAPQYAHSGTNDERLTGVQWSAALEAYGGLEAFALGGNKYCTTFGRDIIDSIPPGSIYFGGTDPGRFVVTAMCKSQVNGDPFFTLTQNALADGGYLSYLRAMYGSRIYIPTAEDLEQCFKTYTEDAERRVRLNQLKPGEDVKIVNGKAQVSGRVAVMAINALLAKVIFDRNPDREFYLQESFPLDWMYPYLEPHGLIFKINREPLSTLPETVVRQDREYWTRCVRPMIGNWLTYDTPVANAVAFVNKVHLKKDLNGFKGDPQFIHNEYAERTFAKLRFNIADIYLWRMAQSTDPAEKARMARAAGFALLQAWTLCPDSDEAVFRYVKFLAGQHRSAEAVLVGETACRLPALQVGRGAQLRDFLRQLK